MENNNVMVIGNWRTGSNLLIKMFTDQGYYDFNEFYSLTGASTIIKKELPNLDMPLVNRYLVHLIHQPKIKNCTIKVNYPHIGLPNSLVFDHFEHKLLLYRTDIFQAAISRIVAEKRKSWVASDEKPIQPLFNEDIDTVSMKTMIGRIVLENQRLRKYYDTTLTSFVVNYEEDLVPYAKDHIKEMHPSNNYYVKNYDELKYDTLNDPYFIDNAAIINEYFTKLRMMNTRSFSDYLIKIKEKSYGK